MTVTAPLFDVRALVKRFPVERGLLRRTVGFIAAVDGIDLTLEHGTTLGLVGESGSGKTTVGRMLLRLIEPTGGVIEFEGQDVTQVGGAELRRFRREVQIVFQDPHAAFDPSATVLASLREPMKTHLDTNASVQRDRARELMDLVGLGPHLLERYPRELSGGQLQRVAVARALVLDPKVLVLDEPVSSLDVSSQAQVVNLLKDLQARLGVAYLFIAHDLSVVRHVSHRVAVMYLGRIVEEGPAESIFNEPRHPYTEALLDAIPAPDPVHQRTRDRIILTGEIPSPANLPSGCRFHTRCPYAFDICRDVDPEPLRTADGTTVACHLHTRGPVLNGAPLTSAVIPRR